jgi:hypothetical protein
MRWARARQAFALAVALGALFVDVARAEPPTTPALLLEYAAPGNCPPAADFQARVKARTPLARFADEDDARALKVVVRPTGTAYAGHLSLVGRSGHISERDVEDTLCSDVVDALALITALAVDPNAQLAATASSAAPAPATTDSSAAEVIPLVEAPAPRSRPSIPKEAPSQRRRPVATPARPFPATFAVGGTFATMAGIAPDTLVGGGAFGAVESKSDRWLAPSLRLTLLAAENGAFATRDASFLLLAARLDVCPLRLGRPELSLRPCVGADLGAVEAKGIDAVAGGTGKLGTEPWGDLQALLRLRGEPGLAHVFVEGEGGVFVPLNRSSFVYDHPVHILDTPWLVGVLGIVSVGVDFR